MNSELFFGNGLGNVLNQSIANTDDQKFIDINIDSDENDESTSSDTTASEGHQDKGNKSFLFNFKSSSSTTTTPVAKKLSHPEKTKSPEHAPLQASVSSPISSKMKIFNLNKAADILLSNLNEMNLNNAYDDDDDDDEETEDDDEDCNPPRIGASSTDNSNANSPKANDLIRRRFMVNQAPLKASEALRYNSSSNNLTGKSGQLSDANNNLLPSTENAKRNSLFAEPGGDGNSQFLHHSTPLVSESSHMPSRTSEHDLTIGADSLMNMSTSTKIGNFSTLSSPSASDFNEMLSSTMAEIGDGLNDLNSSSISGKVKSSAAVFYKAYKNFSNSKSSTVNRQDSIVDVLLGDIYDRFNISHNKENLLDSEVFHSEFSASSSRLSGSDVDSKHARNNLENLNLQDLKELVNQLNSKVNQMSTKLIKQLKYKDKLSSKVTRNCEIITAFLQARSQKRRVDTQMKFTLNPMPGEAGFNQWKDAMKALARLPGGVPKEFRKSIWLNLAENYITEINLDWNKVKRIAFNDRSNPDDDELGIQIVKDLHRTGCSAFSGQENEQDRALLKRVLLAFARYNKSIGYCQGFNIIAALILEIVDKKEEDAFMCMIYLIDHIMPEGYFTNTMHLLAIDMAVFREILKGKLPKLCEHLSALQYNMNPSSKAPPPTNPGRLGKSAAANQTCTYEPPLTNVFTMQWFLTLFATCLPKSALLRVWDCIFLEGSEILFRTSIAIWEKLSVSIMKANSADAFYSMMSVLTVRLFDPNVIDENELIAKIYSYGPFPLPGLAELREKFTFNITPFQMYLQSNETGGKKAPKTNSTNPFDIGLSHLKKSDKLSSSNSSISSISSLSPKNSKKVVSLIDDDNLDETLVAAAKSSKSKAKHIDDLDLNNLRKATDNEEMQLDLTKFNDDDEVEDLAKMISCFALLMPARSSSSSSSTHSRDDIMMAAAAAANAYSQKGASRGLKLASAAAAAAKGLPAKSVDSRATASPKIDQQAGRNSSKHDISMVTPGAFSYITQMYNPKPLEEQLTLDLNELKKQYQKVKERQQQAHIIIRTASAQHRMKTSSPSNSSQSPSAPSTSAAAASGPSPAASSNPTEPPSPNHSKDKIPKIGNLKETTYSPYTLESFPVVNHLLIKPSDPQKNTVKTSIHIKSGEPMTTPVKPGSLSSSAASRINSVRSSVSCNESIAGASAAVKTPVAKKTSKPYYSDDDEDDDDDEVVDDMDFNSTDYFKNDDPFASSMNRTSTLNTAVNSPTEKAKHEQFMNFIDLTESHSEGVTPTENHPNTQAKMDLLNITEQLSSSSSSSSSSSTLSLSSSQKDSNMPAKAGQASPPQTLTEESLATSMEKSAARRANVERSDSNSSGNTSISSVSKTNKTSVSRKSSENSTTSKKMISTMIIENLANEERKQLPLHNPFKAKQLNSNVAKNGMRLGLYK